MPGAQRQRRKENLLLEVIHLFLLRVFAFGMGKRMAGEGGGEGGGGMKWRLVFNYLTLAVRARNRWFQFKVIFLNIFGVFIIRCK